jgi:hypothetical protein
MTYCSSGLDRRSVAHVNVSKHLWHLAMTRKGNNPAAETLLVSKLSQAHILAPAPAITVEGQDTTHCNHVVRQITLGTIRIVEAFLRVHIIVGLLLGTIFFWLARWLNKPDKDQEEGNQE